MLKTGMSPVDTKFEHLGMFVFLYLRSYQPSNLIPGNNRRGLYKPTFHNSKPEDGRWKEGSGTGDLGVMAYETLETLLRHALSWHIAAFIRPNHRRVIRFVVNPYGQHSGSAYASILQLTNLNTRPSRRSSKRKMQRLDLRS